MASDSSMATDTTGVDSASDGRPEGPPEEAFAACEQKAANQSCFFASPWGDVVEGTCRVRRDDPNRLVCFPGEWPGRGRPDGPPEGLVAACGDKAVNDACTVTSPRGDAVAGRCEAAPDGSGQVLCLPEGWPGEGEPRGPHRGPEQAKAACEDLAHGATCTFEGPFGSVGGTCTTGRDGTSLVCAPAGWPPR